MRSSRDNTNQSVALLSPPLFFSLVQPLLYRSATPISLNFPFLNTLYLKTIVSLGPDLPGKTLLNWCAQQGIEFVSKMRS